MSNPTNQKSRFDELVVPHIETLYRTAWVLTRSTTESEDLVQETLLKAYKALGRFDGRYPKAWLITILKNTNINRARKKTPELLKDPDVAFEHSELFTDPDDPESLVIDPMFDSKVEDAFAELKPNAQEIVKLIDLEGLSYAEASRRLDIPVGTVMSRLHRARGQMKTKLSHSEGDQ